MEGSNDQLLVLLWTLLDGMAMNVNPRWANTTLALPPWVQHLAFGRAKHIILTDRIVSIYVRRV